MSQIKTSAIGTAAKGTMTLNDSQGVIQAISDLEKQGNDIQIIARKLSIYLNSQPDAPGGMEIGQVVIKAFEMCTWLQMARAVVKAVEETNPASKIIKN